MMEKRIIIIDDDNDILEALQDLLELEGYSVRVNPKGDHAIEHIQEFHPHVVLLDLLLSGKDGATICREIRNTPDIHTIPVIMMSAHPYAQKQISGAGASAFLHKPFNVEELLQLLNEFITP